MPAAIVGVAIVVVGVWLVAGAIVWYSSETPPPDENEEQKPNCSDCKASERKWKNMDGWAKAAAFLTYTGVMANCALKGCKIGY